jgi:DNA-binding transcriptional regulator YiaG
MSRVTCPGCGSGNASARELPRYHYTESGLDNIWLAGGATETRCPTCGEAFVRIWKESQLLQLVARDLLMEARHHTGAELRFVRKACGMSQEQLAALLKCRRATVADREARVNPGLSLPEEVGLRLLLLNAFQQHLAAPGNNALETAQLRELWNFATLFHDFAAEVVNEQPKPEKRTAAVHAGVWTLNKRAA